MLLHELAFPQTTFYTNQLLHKRAFTRISLYANIANQLFDQPAFTQTTFCTNQLLQTSFYTNQLLHKPALHKPTFRQATFYYMQTTFYTNQLYTTPALGLLAKGQRAGRMPKALKYMSKHTSMYIHVYPGGIFTGFTTWSKYVNIVVSLQWQDAFCPQNVITKNIRCFWRGQPFLHFLFKTTLVLLCQLSSCRAWAVCSRRLCWLFYFPNAIGRSRCIWTGFCSQQLLCNSTRNSSVTSTACHRERYCPTPLHPGRKTSLA